jgi:hypothetical protein
MPPRREAVSKRGDDTRRSQHIDGYPSRTGDWPLVSERRPSQQGFAENRDGLLALSVREYDKRRIGQIIYWETVTAFAAAFEPLLMENAVHLRRAERRSQPPPGCEGVRKRDRVLAPALEARPMPRGERCDFVEKKQLGIIAAPHIALPVFELQDTANPLAGCEAPRTQRSIVVVKLAAAIAE